MFEASSAPGLVAALAAGMLSFLSPCVLPLVPAYLSMMSGLSTADVGSPAGAERRSLALNAVLFVLGFTAVFIAYGAVASEIGSLFAEHRARLSLVAGAVIVVMGLVMAGVLRPAALLRERRFHVAPAALGPYAAPVMGMAFAFGWTPCIGPVLAAVLTLAAGRETLDQGVYLLLAYSLGLGVPFVVAGVAFGRLRTTWEWLKRHGRTVDRISGALLIAFGVLLLSGHLGWLAALVLRVWTAAGLDRLLAG